MTPLAQTALDFARECLGWEDADIPNGATSIFDRHGRGWLKPTDLNAVMEAARGWCDRHDHWVDLHSYWDEGWMAEVGPSGEDDGEDAVLPDPCHALMAACVGAARKLKSAG
jgi:hypothetical protein